MAAIDFSWMLGRRVNEVTFTESSCWYFLFSDSGAIGVECPWRLVQNERIVVSGDDHGQQFGLPEPVDGIARAKAALAGQVVREVDFREGTADLVLRFDGDARLEIIPFSSGYESWQILDPSGRHFFAQGGGNVVG